MSRTRHHRNQDSNKCGLDFGAKYKCNKGYSGGCGTPAKNAANSDRRIDSKRIIKEQVDEAVLSQR